MSGPYYQFPFPLENGGIAYLHIPGQLTARDAERLVAYVKSLVMDAAPTPLRPRRAPEPRPDTGGDSY